MNDVTFRAIRAVLVGVGILGISWGMAYGPGIMRKRDQLERVKSQQELQIGRAKSNLDDIRRGGMRPHENCSSGFEKTTGPAACIDAIKKRVTELSPFVPAYKGEEIPAYTFKITNEDIGATMAELDALRKHGRILEVGTKVLELLATVEEISEENGWDVCTKRDLGKEIKDIGQEATVEKIDLWNLEGFSPSSVIKNAETGNRRTKVPPMSQESLKMLANTSHWKCVDALFNQLVHYPERGIEGLEPTAIVKEITKHHGYRANGDRRDMSQERLSSLSCTANGRQATYLVRKFRADRVREYVLYPETIARATEIKKVLGRCQLPYKEAGTTVAEIEALVGRDPNGVEAGQAAHKLPHAISREGRTHDRRERVQQGLDSAAVSFFTRDATRERVRDD